MPGIQNRIESPVISAPTTANIGQQIMEESEQEQKGNLLNYRNFILLQELEKWFVDSSK
jgi:hypothetical protein